MILFVTRVSIGLASPKKIRSWSYGEVIRSETINHQTFKPEIDGLFCPRIFGPVRDFECLCKKPKKQFIRNNKCEICGVELIKAISRRSRMGHINLYYPVVHVWYLKSLPSYIANLLGLSILVVEKIINFKYYLVIESGNSSIKEKCLITESQNTILSKFKNFKSYTGAVALEYMLASINIKYELELIKKIINSVKRLKKIDNKLYTRFKLLNNFYLSDQKPEWMILKVLPVIPPDLRPLVALDGDQFASSDLNDLYKRVINCNNRLGKFLRLKSPEIILKNERRMLQEAVDSLFDNGRRGTAILNNNNKQPLKSLSSLMKGKEGRFRQNLLGKRVDYSGRSVIIVNPCLKLFQCGIPRKMALELFRPFIYSKLKQLHLSLTISHANILINSHDPKVWYALSLVIKEHPVLLNRAPTLHRLGIQAFIPILVESAAIQLHPLVCSAFNADFDGDQMALHIPLTLESQLETRILMLSINNLLSPTNGTPIVTPTLDIVLGLYYLSLKDPTETAIGSLSTNLDLDSRLHFIVQRTIKNNILNKKGFFKSYLQKKKSSIGIFKIYSFLPRGLPFFFINKLLKKNVISDLVSNSVTILGFFSTSCFLNKLMFLGFYYSTLAGISISFDDLLIPKDKKNHIKIAFKKILSINDQYTSGFLTSTEKYNKTINIWSSVTILVSNLVVNFLKKSRFSCPKFSNSLYIMFASGSKGSLSQLSQILGMRGLMAKPDGTAVETPIISNFKEGLSILEYFISTHGSRKGLADTALKTANAGYLTRRLVDVSQAITIKEYDCNTKNGIYFKEIIYGKNESISVFKRAEGRTLASAVYSKYGKRLLFYKNTLITKDVIQTIKENAVDIVKVRSPITCQSREGLCARCYGLDLAKNSLVCIGEPVGTIAAQAIGEPGTQLTMRTFHSGGVFTQLIENDEIKIQTKKTGRIFFYNRKFLKNSKNAIISYSSGLKVNIRDINATVSRYSVPYGSHLTKYIEGAFIKKSEDIFLSDTHSTPIICLKSGFIKIHSFSEDCIPKISIVNSLEDNSDATDYTLPKNSILCVDNNSKVLKGDILAKLPHSTKIKSIKNRDITGGLSKVVKLFEAVKTETPFLLSPLSGTVIVLSNSEPKEYFIYDNKKKQISKLFIPCSRQINIANGQKISKGDELSKGTEDLYEILRSTGVQGFADFILKEVHTVYASQGVYIDDKHIEIILRQMLQQVIITNRGDSNFFVGEKIKISEVSKINEILKKKGGRTISYDIFLLGITKAALNNKSFLSAASFQETTKVLSQATMLSKKDYLAGLKENILMGQLIPAGSNTIKWF